MSAYLWIFLEGFVSLAIEKADFGLIFCCFTAVRGARDSIRFY